jgi:dTDP-4-amino-4,6-dideoxygalactose transaminase
MDTLALHGGSKSCDITWPQWPQWDDTERTALNGVLESGEWRYGEQVARFERDFAAFQDARYAITASSGTTAQEIALTALGIGPGDEVIVPPYTFVATAAAVFRVGATPIFADILPHNLCLDPADAARKITPRTRAIMPVHLAGHIADMDALGALCEQHGLALIEDACHAWGGRWRGRGVGAIGRCGVFSFQVSKNIASGEGGVLVTDDEALADIARSITNCGRVKGGAWYEHARVATNARLTEFQGAILNAQLARLEAQTLRREANGRLLNAALRGIPGICVIDDDPRITRRAYHLYPFRLDLNALGVTRERFVDALTSEGVPASNGYIRPLYKNAMFTDVPERAGRRGVTHDYARDLCPVTEQVCNDTVWLFHTLLLADGDAMAQIAGAIAKVVANARALRL